MCATCDGLDLFSKIFRRTQVREGLREVQSRFLFVFHLIWPVFTLFLFLLQDVLVARLQCFVDLLVLSRQEL